MDLLLLACACTLTFMAGYLMGDMARAREADQALFRLAQMITGLETTVKGLRKLNSVRVYIKDKTKKEKLPCINR